MKVVRHGTYKKVKTLTAVEASYIAGLIDGEGTITLSRKHSNENRQLVVSISSTEDNLLNYVQNIVAAGRITSKRTYSNYHTPSKTYQISNRQALDLLKQVAPYLKSCKAERAALVLDKYIRVTPRNGRYSSLQRKEREAFIEMFFCISANRVRRPTYLISVDIEGPS